MDTFVVHWRYFGEVFSHATSIFLITSGGGLFPFAARSDPETIFGVVIEIRREKNESRARTDFLIFNFDLFQLTSAE